MRAPGVHSIERLGVHPFFLKPRQKLAGHIHVRPACIGGLLTGHFIRSKILCRNAQHLRLDAGHNVPGDQGGGCAAVLEPSAYFQNPVVPAVRVHPRRQGDVYAVYLQAQRPPAGERHAVRQAALEPLLLQKADDLAGVCTPLSISPLQPVQFLQDGQGQHNMVVLERLQGIGRLDEHICVEYIGFLHGFSRLSLCICRSTRPGKWVYLWDCMSSIHPPEAAAPPRWGKRRVNFVRKAAKSMRHFCKIPAILRPFCKALTVAAFLILRRFDIREGRKACFSQRRKETGFRRNA